MLSQMEKSSRESHQIHYMLAGKRGLLTANSCLPGELISITGEDLSQLDFTLSQPSTHSGKMGRRATDCGALAAKETLSKPSKCLSRYIGAEVMPGKHTCSPVSFS